jgi:3-hydroxyacyl-CoA dehydrogenase
MVSIPERLIPAKENRQRSEQDRALKKIDLVIDATIEKLKVHGEAGVNIKDIAAETGVSYGAIYHHFKWTSRLLRMHLITPATLLISWCTFKPSPMQLLTQSEQRFDLCAPA